MRRISAQSGAKINGKANCVERAQDAAWFVERRATRLFFLALL
jgi:hypothetical protein